MLTNLSVWSEVIVLQPRPVQDLPKMRLLSPLALTSSLHQEGA